MQYIQQQQKKNITKVKDWPVNPNKKFGFWLIHEMKYLFPDV